MADVGTNILSMESFQIDFFRATLPTRKLIFSFTESSNRALDGLGFGGTFAIENGFDLIAIKSNLDDWYQSLPSNTFDLIESFLAGLPARHTSRATYGSSMGAYAAIYFARDIRADVALALSPQFDISQAWDQRWARSARELGSIRTLTRESICEKCHYVLMYDPINLDRLHYEKFAEVIPSDLLSAIKLPYAGHPVGYFLSSGKILKEIAAGVMSGSEIHLGIRHKIRAARRTYADYFLNLSRHCLKKRKLRWAGSLISKAITLVPLNSEYRILASQIAEASGDLVGALSHAALAVAIVPKNPHMAATLSRVLQRKGLHRQALHYIDIALLLEPGSASLAKQRAAIERVMGPSASQRS